MSQKRNMSKKHQGFTLVEITVVLAIIALIFGAGFSTLSAYIDNANQSHTKGSLDVTKRALLNFVVVNKHMPCPDLDGDGSGADDRTGQKCNGYLGTVPYDDIGIPKATASDDYGNLFGYAVNKLVISSVMDLDVTDTSEGGGADQLADSPGSYFYSQGAPAFDLYTPPTESAPGDPNNSYQICGRYSLDDCSGANDVVNDFIQAVIVAYNENGDTTKIDNCNSGDRGTREHDNCDIVNMRFTKGIFNADDFDDQLETISAYEIKQQVDLSSGSFDSTFAFEDYEYIVNKDLTSTNDFNTGTKEAGTDVNGDGDFEDTGDVYGDSLYVTGDIDSNINMLAGSNKLKVEGNVNAVVNGGDDVDYYVILSNVESGGAISTEKGDDTVLISGSLLYKGDVNLGQDDDSITIGGSIGGDLDTGTGLDDVIVKGDITGTVTLGSGDGIDTIVLYGDLIRGTISGGAEDKIYVTATQAEWDQVQNDPTAAGTIIGIPSTSIEYGYVPQ